MTVPNCSKRTEHHRYEGRIIITLPSILQSGDLFPIGGVRTSALDLCDWLLSAPLHEICNHRHYYCLCLKEKQEELKVLSVQRENESKKLRQSSTPYHLDFETEDADIRNNSKNRYAGSRNLTWFFSM
jgi:hypothetical protein